MELVQEVRAAVVASANAEYAVWMTDAAGLDLAPFSLPGTSTEAWVVSPRSARPPVGFLAVRVGAHIEVTTGDAAAAGRVLASLPVPPAPDDLPPLIFELLRSRARPMLLTRSGPDAPVVTTTAEGTNVTLHVTRGILVPERWSVRLARGTLQWTRTPAPQEETP